MEKVWYIEDPEEKSAPGNRNRRNPQVSTPEPVTVSQKNPALAFSLSILIWGGGQFYNRDWKLGVLLMLLMMNFWAFLGAVIFSWRFLPSAFNPYFSSPDFHFVGWVSSFFAFLIWFSGAVQAYRKADKHRTSPFTGIENRLLPPLCSFLIPGWGQFLNGQFKKGSFFILASVLWFSSITSISILFLLWPSLGPSPVKSVLEWDFALSLMIMPFLVLIWLVSVFDAFKVSCDDVKKESWLKRVSYAINRVRIKGWGNTVLKQAQMTALLLLLLVIAIYAGSRYIPADYYEKSARHISETLSGREMVIVPRIINRALEKISLSEVEAYSSSFSTSSQLSTSSASSDV